MQARTNPRIKLAIISIGLLAACSDAEDGALGPDPTSAFVYVSAGLLHTCALTDGGEAYCWGWGAYGQLGNGGTSNADVPAAVLGGHTFESISAGGGHTCGIAVSGDTYCWGFNLNGQLGDGTNENSSVPVQVSGDVAFLTVNADGNVTCGLDGGGAAYCWGYNEYGQIGDGTNQDRNSPAAVSGDFSFASISTAGFHVCGLTAAGETLCWGSNQDGQLGNPDSDGSAPQTVAGALAFQVISAGISHTCGVTTGDAAYCWGKNDLGQLGDSTGSRRTEPTVVSGGATNYVDISAGGAFSCGLRASGEIWCWGFNENGQLGAGAPQICSSETQTGVIRSFPCSLYPIQGGGGLLFTQISSNTQHTCGLGTDDKLYCWGLGERGQLGNGQSGSAYVSVTPVLVARQQ